MMRALGKGTITQHTSDTAQSSYRLEAHASDAETNQRNTLILRPATNTGQAETASNGFFHVLTDTMELPFPAVTSSTTYHVCVTYDPRLFKTTPLKIEVYPGTPPTSEGRDHVVLFTVQRQVDQLLSQAVIGRVNQWLGHVINAWSYKELPDPTHVEYGTLAVVINPTSNPTIYTSRGVWGWVRITNTGEWQDMPSRGVWTASSSYPPQYRVTPTGVELRGRFEDGGLQDYRARFFALPSELRPIRTLTLPILLNPASRRGMLAVSPAGDLSLAWVDNDDFNFIYLDGITIPLD